MDVMSWNQNIKMHPPPKKKIQKQTTNIPTHKNPPKDKSCQNYSYKVKDILILFICFNELLCKNKKNPHVYWC